MTSAVLAVSLALALPAAASPSRVGWSVQSTPSPHRPPNSSLSYVSCPAANDCIAVGNSYGGQGNEMLLQNPSVTLAERWNGRRWWIQPTPNLQDANGTFLNISCSSARACTAVGYSYDYPDGFVSLAERWDGRGWTIQRTPNPRGAELPVLSGISCTSVSACTAVGYASEAQGTHVLVERWNGRKWTIWRAPDADGADDSDLVTVSCPSARSCTAVGFSATTLAKREVYATLAERWNGRRWTIQRTVDRPVARNWLADVSCVSATACTAVGASGVTPPPRNGTGVTLAEYWDGRRWTIEPSPNRANEHAEFLGVSCVAASACTAIGDSYAENAHKSSRALAERWNGSKWTIQRTPVPNPARPRKGGELLGISCASENKCTAVGNYHSGSTRSLVEHWHR